MQVKFSADWYFQKDNDKWQKAKIAIREIALDCDLSEGLAYGKPTYASLKGKLFLIHTFKDYIAVLFFKGSLMQDPAKILTQQTPNVQAARQLRFDNVEQIQAMKDTIKEYIQEAINVENSGQKVVFKAINQYEFPEEFKEKLAQDSLLADAFYALTPGRQRGYLLYFSSAKLPKTRQDRINLSEPHILKGKGRLKGSGFEQ
ncbi:MAG: YdeI/OmpD-associated family protein [Candidatus Parcubacteria bacterium]|nr:YdeI/OmpD-associated family protein [Candidatus Paceibacterota bacterium]